MHKKKINFTYASDIVEGPGAILNAHSFLLNVHARLFLPRTISIIKCFTCNILSEKDGEYGRFQSIKYFSFAMMIAMKASPGNGKIMKQLDLL